MAAQSKHELIKAFRRDEIISAAYRVIQKKGYDFTLDQVAGAAGLAKGTIYLYFDNKDDLVLSVISDGIRRQSRASREELEGKGTLSLRLKRMILSQVRFFAEHEQLFLYFHLKKRTAPHALKKKIYIEMHRVFDEYLSMLATYLKQAMDRGEIRKIDPGRLASILLETVNGVLLHHMYYGRSFNPASEASFILDLIFKGIEVKNKGRGGKKA
jgi:AcrR family transcriptional regulator